MLGICVHVSIFISVLFKQLDVVIPSLANHLNETHLPETPLDHSQLIEAVHSKGVNLRLLGKLRALINGESLRSLILEEMMYAEMFIVVCRNNLTLFLHTDLELVSAYCKQSCENLLPIDRFSFNLLRLRFEKLKLLSQYIRIGGCGYFSESAVWQIEC